MCFPVFECPRLVRQVADSYKDLVEHYYAELVAVLCSAIFGLGSLSQTHRFLFFSRSVSQLSRFLDSPQVAGKLSRRHRKRLFHLLPELLSEPSRYLWAVDDTVISNRGKRTWGVYSWWDNSDRCFRFGHKLLVIGIVDRRKKAFIPVIWEILHKDLKRPLFNPLYQKATEVALRLMKQLIEAGFPKLTVVGDSWYAGETIYAGLRKLALDYVFEVRLDGRCLTEAKYRPIAKVRCRDYFSKQPRHKIAVARRAKYATEAVVRFNNSKAVHKAAAFAIRKSIDHEIFAIYVTSKLTWNASEMWKAGRDRWAVEVQFRDLKGLFTLGEPAVRSQQSVETSVCIAMIALTVIRLEQLSESAGTKHQHFRPKPAGYIVRELQMQAMHRGLSKLARSQRARQQFQQRLSRENLNRKPAEVRKKPLDEAHLPIWRVTA